jgi:hypothetical protein
MTGNMIAISLTRKSLKGDKVPNSIKRINTNSEIEKNKMLKLAIGSDC